MTKVVVADDGLPAEEVHEWVRDKHAYLSQYVSICAHARAKTDQPAFIDPFCSCGRSKIIESGEFVAGSPLVAWNASASGAKPFHTLFVGDRDDERRQACVTRLRRAAAPVVEVAGDALRSVKTILGRVKPEPVHLAFLDPHSLGQLDFGLIRMLAHLQRVDLLIHVSVMDLQRNVMTQAIAREDQDEFDRFAPGWKDAVGTGGSQREIRTRLLKHWLGLVRELRFEAFATDMIRGRQGERLYWLMLLTRDPLGERLWKATLKATPAQRRLL